MLIYSTAAKAKGGRNGEVATEDGVLSVSVRMPKALGGADDEHTNPEQLFAAGYAACFDSALNLVARTQKLKITSEIRTEVGLMKNQEGGFDLKVAIEAKIEGVEKAQAQALLEAAHAVCPYSRAIRGNVDCSISLAD
ncbi:peroxiredoxin, Ohr subfamily [Saprospira grandis DSM 2844]|uniref:Peroxiredoxin, Ohr subfamily n=1 Tax=Saprospira grandis DSM 2844 TaxID=694433 RepID=J1I688_9BACT|nr:organic hydroperoxide resistance protein [Saprospira grandis]EJF54285.1 peroxiredoxin, Ohr subfamily [Saprospira grandis DSM 2844]